MGSSKIEKYSLQRAEMEEAGLDVVMRAGIFVGEGYGWKYTCGHDGCWTAIADVRSGFSDKQARKIKQRLGINVERLFSEMDQSVRYTHKIWAYRILIQYALNEFVKITKGSLMHRFFKWVDSFCAF